MTLLKDTIRVHFKNLDNTAKLCNSIIVRSTSFNQVILPERTNDKFIYLFLFHFIMQYQPYARTPGGMGTSSVPGPPV